MRKIMERFIQIRRDDGSWENISDYIGENLSITSGDVSGVGDQGNDGIATSLSLNLKNDDYNNIIFSPFVFYGVTKYHTEIIIGDG